MHSVILLRYSLRWLLNGVSTCVLLLSTNLLGQESGSQSKATITATGIAEVVLAPDRIRLRQPLRIESRDGEMALRRFIDHQKKATKDLVTLGASEKSIEFTKPRVSVGIPDVSDPDAAKKQVRNQAIQMRNMNPGMQGQFPIPAVDSIDNLDLPRVYAAESVLTAEWKLTSGLDNAATLLPSKILMAIDEKDIPGKQFTEVLSAEEQKLIQPLLGNQMYYQQQNQVSDQRLSFVAEMTEAQEQQAIDEAVKKARSQASLLAQAAGIRLGKVRSIQRQPFSDHTAVASNFVYAYPATTVYPGLGSSVKNEREVLNIDPNSLRKTVSVSMVFEIDQAE